MRFSRLLAAASMAALAVGAAHAQPGRRSALPGQAADESPAPQVSVRPADSRPAAPAVDHYKQTQHTGTFGGQTVAYTASAGTLVLKSAEGKPRANVFFVAYTKDGVSTGSRPIAFAYNGATERKEMAAKVARFTGLSAPFVDEANLRVSPARFRKELLRDQRKTVGRLDGRYTGLDRDAAGERQEFDPSNTALQGAYTALFSEYAKNALKWESDLPYVTSANVRPWQYEPGRYLNLVDDLRTAMARNPFLHVMVVNGYYDMATPFAGSEYTFDHLGYEKTYADRISFAYYEGGHMMYIRPNMLKALKGDIAAFVNRTRGAK